ncbi:ninjurin-2 isoform X2 [Diaphorina citri]|uniref:Ninjurin-2 isoform X2 n=1 Tax=Diaphorina citri TaxID=121845 RepID=A0A1S3D520_DIACI|nr:ninjurin-2 isoform X2 [Diaphorina citri]
MATADKEMENSNAVTDIRAFNVDDVSANPQKPIDVNRYATKKTIAQGMLDIALLTANASQLKYILQVGEKHEFYTLMLVLISTSIVLQIIVGVLFLIIGGMNINKACNCRAANILNDVILIIIFLISAINVIISVFGMENSSNMMQLMSQTSASPPYRPL